MVTDNASSQNEKAKYQNRLEDVCPIYGFLGVQIKSISDGIYSCVVPLGTNTKNHVNIMHAGPTIIAAECLGGLIVFRNVVDPKFQVVVSNVQVKFLRPGLTDIVAETKFSKEDAQAMNTALSTIGRHQFTIRVDIKDRNGALLGQSICDYVIRDFTGILPQA